MKLRDLIYRLSSLWDEFAISEWDANCEDSRPLYTCYTMHELENIVWDGHMADWEVINIVPMIHGVHIIVKRKKHG